MKRGIKFRVWDATNKKFWFVDHKDILYGQRDFCTYPYEKCDSILLQQYTGLEDENGKEIYEGDVVKTVPDYMSAIINVSKYSAGEVRWWNEGFAVCQEVVGATRISEYAHCECCPSSLEVIGNIFETPELLKSVV